MQSIPRGRVRPLRRLAAALLLLAALPALRAETPVLIPEEVARGELPMPPRAPVTAGAAASGQARYIVTLRRGSAEAPAESERLVRGQSGRIRQHFGRALRGYSAEVPVARSQAFIESLRRNPEVLAVELDQPLRLRQTIQSAAPWGLDRSDQRSLPLSGGFSYLRSGQGVRAYIVDTGILASHQDFGGRVLEGYSSVADANGSSDCNGHGTHVAGIVGGSTWGVAKAVGLVPVRVLDCNGSGMSSSVIAGLDWILAHGVKPAVVNLSLGGGVSPAMDAAVARLVAEGYAVVVAAGNSGVDACTSSPGREPSVLTVGASTATDERASYSNFGRCVDLFAPGSSIRSAYGSGPTATATMSGTSMAAPHVSGALALLLQRAPTATPAQLLSTLKTEATSGKLKTVGTGSPNLLLFSAIASSPIPRSSAVDALSGSAAASGSAAWLATVSVVVRDQDGVYLPKVTVKGSFSGGGSASCVTGSTGVCSLKSAKLKKTVLSTRFDLTGLSGGGVVYDATRNRATQLTLARP